VRGWRRRGKGDGARVGEGLVVLLIKEEKGGRWMKGGGDVELSRAPLPDIAIISSRVK
jgi:hypothetical protein